jgi:hypothetical protein
MKKRPPSIFNWFSLYRPLPVSVLISAIPDVHETDTDSIVMPPVFFAKEELHSYFPVRRLRGFFPCRQALYPIFTRLGLIK